MDHLLGRLQNEKLGATTADVATVQTSHLIPFFSKTRRESKFYEKNKYKTQPITDNLSKKISLLPS